MQLYNDAYVIWNSIIEQTLSAGKPLSFPKILDNGTPIPSPEDTEPKIFQKSIGELKGQIADWRVSFDDRKEGFHAVEFDDHYETHIDSVDPAKDPIGHLIHDSPGTLLGIVAAVAIGGLIAYVFTRKK